MEILKKPPISDLANETNSMINLVVINFVFSVRDLMSY